MLRLCPGCLDEHKKTLGTCARCGRDLPSLSTTRTNRHCPDCDLPLLRYSLAELPVEQCRGCHGIFVERQDLERLYAHRAAMSRNHQGVPATASHATHTPSAPSGREEVRFRRCPRCSRLMRHRLFGAVILDMCEQHGTWFDHGELQKAVWFACSGGRVRKKDLEGEEMHSRLDALRKEREQARRAEKGSSTGDTAAELSLWWGEDLLAWLWLD